MSGVVDAWAARELDPAAGPLPSLVGAQIAGRAVVAEVDDVERTVRVRSVDSADGALGRLGISVLGETEDGATTRWVLLLPAAGGEQVAAGFAPVEDEVPPLLARALADVAPVPWSTLISTVQVRTVRHLLDDSGADLGRIVDDVVGPLEPGPGAGPVRRLQVVGATPAVQTALATAVTRELPPTAQVGGAADPADAARCGWLAAMRVLVAAAPALRLDLDRASELAQGGVRAVLAAMAVRRQVEGEWAPHLRVEVDWWDGALSALAAHDAATAALLAALPDGAVDAWVVDQLSAQHDELLADVQAALATQRWQSLQAELAGSDWDAPSPGDDVLDALAERSLKRVERRLAELGRVHADHDVLWMVAGSRRAVARAVFPALLGGRRRKRADRLRGLLAEADRVLGMLGATVRAEALAARLTAEAPPPAATSLASVLERLALRRDEHVAAALDLRARLRKTRKG
jgi:hypothetical protein